MNFDRVLLAPRLAPMKANGMWRDQTIDVFFQRALKQFPDKIAVVAYRDRRDEPVRLSYEELDARDDRVARSLAALGVGRGDVVNYQLPNWWEFIVLAFACTRIGAVSNPVMPIFRQHELKYILNFGESKIFVVPKTYRGFDYEAMARGMLPDLPHLKHLVIVVGFPDKRFGERVCAFVTVKPGCSFTFPLPFPASGRNPADIAAHQLPAIRRHEGLLHVNGYCSQSQL